MWQRCYVHFRNALDYLARPTTIVVRSGAGSTSGALSKTEQDLQAWLMRWATRYPKDWVEAHIGETLNFGRVNTTSICTNA